MSLYTLLCGLNRMRYEPYVLFGDDGSLNEEMAAMGIDAYCRRRSPALLDVPLLITALRIIRKHRIQLVYLNCALTFSRVIGRAAKLAGIPVIWHVRENPYSNRVRKCLKAMPRIADSLFVVSHEQKMAFKELGVPIKHIANGVVVDRFVRPDNVAIHRSRFELADETLVFCIVGTIEPRKGTAMLVAEFAKLIGEGADVALLIAGDGPKQYVVELDNMLGDLPVTTRKRIHCVGRVADVGPIMWASDVLVMPSTWEGFPRSLIEAMVAGLPAIATDVGDSRFILRDGETGWIIPPKDPVALAAALRQAVTDKSLVPAMGQRAAADALSLYTAEQHAKNMQAAFDDVLS